MKILGYVLMAAGFAWGLVLATGEAPSSDGAPAAGLLGVGFGLLTMHSVRTGSIRGSNRRIYREEQPTAFWVAVAIWTAASIGMIVGAVMMAA